jgi:activator of 2-hydroxyglutaryl-CoA dehydratase
VEQALKRLKQKAEESGTTLDIVGSCSTGYGEELIKAAFNLDDGIIVFLQDVAIA